MKRREADTVEWAWWERFYEVRDELVASVIDQKLAERGEADEDQEVRASARRASGIAHQREADARYELWVHAELGLERGYLRTRTRIDS